MDLKEQYRTALLDLTFNSKPIIDQLAMLAAENIGNAHIIVETIEERIVKSPADRKLPFIYLMDCILKNTGKVYITEFQKNLLTIIPLAYKVLGETERQKIHRLIMTWKAFPKGIIFSMAVLSKLEKDLNAIQNAPALKPKVEQVSAQSVQKNLEFLIAQKQQLNPVLYPQVANEVAVLKQLLHVVKTTQLDQATIEQIANQIKQMGSASQKTSHISSPRLLHPSPVPPVAVPPVLGTGLPLTNPLAMGIGLRHPLNGLGALGTGMGTTNPLHGLGGMGTSAFLPTAGLSSTGLPLLSQPGLVQPLQSSVGFTLPNTLTSNLQASLHGVLAPNMSNTKELPVIQLTRSDITKTFSNLHYHLYDRYELQCKQCGIRFETQPNGKQELEQHLDWHFRQKRRQRERKKACSRDWYLPIEEWIQEQPVDLPDQAVPSLFAVEETQVEVETVIPAGENDTCAVCGEKLEKFYDEDEDAWMVKNATRVGDKLYHDSCYVKGTPTLGKRSLDQGEPEKRVKL